MVAQAKVIKQCLDSVRTQSTLLSLPMLYPSIDLTSVPMPAYACIFSIHHIMYHHTLVEFDNALQYMENEKQFIAKLVKLMKQKQQKQRDSELVEYNEALVQFEHIRGSMT